MEEFSQEQQIVIDKLIKQKYNEAYSKAETKAAETIAAAKLEYNEELTTLKGTVESLQSSSKDTTKRLRGALLKAEIAQLQAVNADQVMRLLDDNFIIDDQQNLVVVDSDGNRRFANEGTPLSVKTFIEEFLTENPHLKQASRSTGGGSFGNKASVEKEGRTMKRAEFDQLPDSAKTNFIRSGGSLTG